MGWRAGAPRAIVSYILFPSASSPQNAGMKRAACRLVAWIFFAALPWGGAPAHAETYCTWVDAEGTTHYATRCPREVDGRRVDVNAPSASREVTEAADEDNGETAPGDDAERAPRTAGDLEAAARRAAQQREQAACGEALRVLDELSTALPVYRDAAGEVHAEETLHHWWYGGSRTYLDGPQRRAAFAEAREEAARLCGPRVDEARPPVATFTRAPLPRDVIQWLAEPTTSPVPVGALCGYASRLARDLRRERPANPTDDMRRLDEAWLGRCAGR